MKDMIDVINKSYKLSKINFVWKKKLDEKNKIMSVQLQGVSEVISDLADDIRDSKNEKYTDKKELIRKILMQKEDNCFKIRTERFRNDDESRKWAPSTEDAHR